MNCEWFCFTTPVSGLDRQQGKDRGIVREGGVGKNGVCSIGK